MRPAPDVIFRTLDDGAVLVHLNGNRIFELNTTGAHVWEMLAQGTLLPAIITSLIEKFDVDANIATQQVDDLIARLYAEGLVEL
jgi:hypothetical protein